MKRGKAAQVRVVDQRGAQDAPHGFVRVVQKHRADAAIGLIGQQFATGICPADFPPDAVAARLHGGNPAARRGCWHVRLVGGVVLVDRQFVRLGERGRDDRVGILNQVRPATVDGVDPAGRGRQEMDPFRRIAGCRKVDAHKGDRTGGKGICGELLHAAKVADAGRQNHPQDLAGVGLSCRPVRLRRSGLVRQRPCERSSMYSATIARMPSRSESETPRKGRAGMSPQGM